MSALADRTVKPELVPIHRKRMPVKGGSTIYANAIVVCDTSDNTVTPAAAGTTFVSAGIAHESVDNSAGADGALLCDVEFFRPKLCVALDNDTGTAITSADLFKVCYWKDDHTVTGDSAGASKAGRVWGFHKVLGTTKVLVEVLDVAV